MTALTPLRLDAALAPWQELFTDAFLAAPLSGIDPGGASAENFTLPVVVPPVVVACSGGADSLALLALAVASGLDPIAVHVDHGIRLDSADEGDFVSDVATRLGSRYHQVRVAVGLGPGIEARARELRYQALETARAELGASVILVGHTEDDQAETVLLHLLRGAASAGLGGMPSRRGRLVRPLLGLTRAATVEICARLGLSPLHDPMNDDIAFKRVWIRREVVPLLESGARRDLRAVLARQAAVLRAESDYLDGLADALLDEAGDPPVGAVIASAPGPLARRAVRRWLGSPPPSLDEVDGVIEVAQRARRSINLPGGDRVLLDGGRLVRETATSIVEELKGSAPFRDQPFSGQPFLDQPVAVVFPGVAFGFGMRVESWVERSAPVTWPDGRSVCVLDAAAAGAQGWLRLPSPGERFVPLGLEGSKPVREVLAEARVPVSERSTHPILVDAAGMPLWVLGYRVDHHARVTPQTRRYLWISCQSAGEAGGEEAGGKEEGRESP